MGRLVRDPDLRYTSGNNTATTSFTLAVNRDFKRDGQPDADFVQIVTWAKTAEFAGKYFTKGLQVAITGKIQTRTWEKDGQKHYVTEVVADRVYFADSKRSNETTTSKPDSYEPPTSGNGDGFYPMDEDDELPF